MYRRYVALAVVLLTCVVGYTVFWFVAASNLENRIISWRNAAQGQGYTATYDALEITGYPFRLIAEFDGLHVSPKNEAAFGAAHFDAVSIVFQAWDTDHAIFIFGPETTLANRDAGGEREIRFTGVQLSISGLADLSGGGGDTDQEWRLSATVDTVSYAQGADEPVLIWNLEQHLSGSVTAQGRDVSFATRAGRVGPFTSAVTYGLGETLDGARLSGHVRLDALDQGLLTLVVNEAELSYGVLQLDGELQGTLDLNEAATSLTAAVTIANADSLFSALETNDRAFAATVVQPLRSFGIPDGLGGLRLSGALLAENWTFADGTMVALRDLPAQLGLEGFRLLPSD